MQITLAKKIISETVSGFIKVVSRRRTTLPVLTHVLFTWDGESRLTAAVTDLEQTLVRELPADCASGDPGQFLLPLDELKNMRSVLKGKAEAVLRPLSAEEIEITTGAGDRTVKRTAGTMSVEEFPHTLEEVPLAECNAGDFLNAFRKAAASTSNDKDRMALTGVYADPEAGAFVGTDGRRMTRALISDFPLNADGIIPASKLLCRFLKAGDETAYAGIFDKEGNGDVYFEFRAGEWRYQCRGIPGTFPAYDKVIPGDNTGWRGSFVFSDEAAEITADAAGQFPPAHQNRIYVYGRGDKAAVCAPNENGGFTGIEIPGCRTEVEGSLLFSVNRAFLVDALKHGFRSARLQDEFTPMRFDAGQDLHVLMPLSPEKPEAAAAYARNLLNETEQADAQPAADTVTGNEKPTESGREHNMDGPDENSDTNKGKKELKVVTPENPFERLKETVRETQETVRNANNAMRELKKQVNAVERYYKNREKDLRNREKDLQKNLKLIEKVQEAVNC